MEGTDESSRRGSRKPNLCEEKKGDMLRGRRDTRGAQRSNPNPAPLPPSLFDVSLFSFHSFTHLAVGSLLLW